MSDLYIVVVDTIIYTVYCITIVSIVLSFLILFKYFLFFLFHFLFFFSNMIDIVSCCHVLHCVSYMDLESEIKI